MPEWSISSKWGYQEKRTRFSKVIFLPVYLWASPYDIQSYFFCIKSVPRLPHTAIVRGVRLSSIWHGPLIHFLVLVPFWWLPPHLSAALWLVKVKIYFSADTSNVCMYTPRQWKVISIEILIFQKIYNTALWLMLGSCFWSTTSWFGEIKHVTWALELWCMWCTCILCFSQFLRIWNHHFQKTTCQDMP